MRIHKLSLENFRCFRKTDLDLSRITILTGPNSSGKSTVIASLLAAIQTQEFPFRLSPNGEFVKMGDFKEMIHRHNPKENLRISLTFDASATANIMIDASYQCDRIGTQMPELKSLTINSPKIQCDVFLQKRDYKVKYKINDEHADAMRSVRKFVMEIARDNPRVGENDKMLKSYFTSGKPKGTFRFKNYGEYQQRAKKTAFLTAGFGSINLITEEFNSAINYIGAFRLSPERTYYRRSTRELTINQFGDNTFDQLFQWEHESSPNLERLSNALKVLGIAQSIRTNSFSGGRYEVLVTPPGSASASTLSDVGFGVSQFLPILVADLQLRDDGILAVSQPEIHLHPSVQASMANYFFERTESSKRQYIIETHSEYLLNRLRLLVAERKLKEEDLAVYYFEPQPGGSRTYKILFKTNGAIEGAPQSFFETYMLDVMKIAMNAE